MHIIIIIIILLPHPPPLSSTPAVLWPISWPWPRLPKQGFQRSVLLGKVNPMPNSQPAGAGFYNGVYNHRDMQRMAPLLRFIQLW